MGTFKILKSAGSCRLVAHTSTQFISCFVGFFFLSILQNGCTAVESLSVQNIFFPELFLSLSSKNPQCMLSSWYSAVFIGVRKMTKEQHNQENTLMLSLILPVCMILLKRVLQFHLNPHFPFLLPPLAWWLCHCWEG